jgi:cell division protein FtsB
VLLAIVIGVLVLSVAPARMYFEQKAELARFERQAVALERRNEALAARAEQLRDHAFLERLARQCLGMVKPGEIAFVVVPEVGAPAPPPEC